MGNLSQRHILADAWVVRSSELGVSSDGGDDMIHCRLALFEFVWLCVVAVFEPLRCVVNFVYDILLGLIH